MTNHPQKKSRLHQTQTWRSVSLKKPTLCEEPAKMLTLKHSGAGVSRWSEDESITHRSVSTEGSQWSRNNSSSEENKSSTHESDSFVHWEQQRTVGANTNSFSERRGRIGRIGNNSGRITHEYYQCTDRTHRKQWGHIKNNDRITNEFVPRRVRTNRQHTDRKNRKQCGEDHKQIRPPKRTIVDTRIGNHLAWNNNGRMTNQKRIRLPKRRR